MCKYYVDRFVDYSSGCSWVILLGINGVMGGHLLLLHSGAGMCETL